MLPNFHKIDDKGTSKSVRRQALKRVDQKWKPKLEAGKSMAKAMTDALKHKSK